MSSVNFCYVIYPAYIGMRQLPGNPHFGEESFPAHRIVGEFGRKEFQCHRLSQLQIIGAVDLTHSTAAQQTYHARYLSARIVPGVNPPAGIESDDIILATCGLAAGDFGDSAAGDSTVGIWENELRGSAQELQKRLPCGF